jgi:hypothetical protein
VPDLREKLRTELTVPLWPDAGKALGIGRQHAYERANSGEICVIKIGRVLRGLRGCGGFYRSTKPKRKKAPAPTGAFCFLTPALEAAGHKEIYAMQVVVPARRPLKTPSPYFAYGRREDRAVLEHVGLHQVARQQIAARLRCLPSLRHEETEAA